MNITHRTGLTNVGNSCFLNTTVQAISRVPPVRQWFTENKHTPACKRDPRKCVDCLIEQHGSGAAKRGVGTAEDLLNIVLDDPANDMQRGAQEDANEAMVSILNNATAAETQGLFGGELSKMGQCDSCGHQSALEIQDFNSLYIPIEGHAHCNVADALKSYLTDIAEYSCPSCTSDGSGVRRRWVNTYSVIRAPEVLAVALGRFKISGQRVVKSKKRVGFGEEISLGGHKYRLDIIIEHKGASVQDGHYVCYARERGNRWVECDDEEVTTRFTEDALRAQPYVLMYTLLSGPVPSGDPATSTTDTEASAQVRASADANVDDDANASRELGGAGRDNANV